MCQSPGSNTACRVLPRIGQVKDDAQETTCAGASFNTLPANQLPPCVAERVSFMAPYELERVTEHPYSKKGNPLYQHFAPTPFRNPPYTAACIPFHWMLKKQAEGDAKKGIVGRGELLQLDYRVDREPNLNFDTDWVQEKRNQLVLLDTFFSAIREDESLCFFYAKRTPLVDDNRRVIIGVGKVKAVAGPIEYSYSNSDPGFRCVLWERLVTHSIRPGFEDGFLFPYHELLARAEDDPNLNLEEFVAFAPDSSLDEYAYGSSHVSHDSAIASLLSCATAIRRISEVIEGPWHELLGWLDSQLNRIWKMRGAFPGFGSALTALGLPHGNLIAYELAAAASDLTPEEFNPWALLEAEMNAPSGQLPALERLVGPTFRKVIIGLAPDRKALLVMLSRFALSDDQAMRFFNVESRERAGIAATDTQLLDNPYLLFELDRWQLDAIPFAVIDRGLFPPDAILANHPIPARSAPTDALDPRRARALVVSILLQAATAGHTLLSAHQLIRAANDVEIQPRCPLTSDTLPVVADGFSPVVHIIDVAPGQGFQLDTYVETRDRIVSAINKRIGGVRHSAAHPWRELLDDELGSVDEADQELEHRAREEKSAALTELYASRISVLVGSAGTGKTTLLRVLCALPEVDRGGVLLLAPTGKARARIEANTGRKARTLAQFLLHYGRFVRKTQRYRITGDANREKAYKTVIVDESSMLTEEQLAALLDALTNVERLILVGDPRQLPPIGAGRPFVDIVRRLEPRSLEASFPRVGGGYAELTVTRRQAGQDRDDLQLARWFAAGTSEATLDAAWDSIQAGKSNHVRLVRWSSPEDLQQKLLQALVNGLGLAGIDDENGFETSLGGTQFGDAVYFSAKWKDRPGAASMAEAWQILSPLRSGLHGADNLNQMIQAQFRKKAIKWANSHGSYRKVPRPIGPQGVLYGDKVMSVVNKERRYTFPEQTEPPYIANGDIGMVVGRFKRKQDTFKGPPKELQVEFQVLPGVQVTYFPNEFSADEATPPLELAYALTVHKTQGSEFGTTFVIIPNPCRMLSRELLYTALTRHQDRIIVLHQGEFRDLMKYNNAVYSDIASRFTNLFRPSREVELAVERKGGIYDEYHIHRSLKGDLVCSKSELVIANALFHKGVDYAYEAELKASDNSIRLPDFTIIDSESGRTFYWEHLGLLHDPGYKRRWAEKIDWYRKQGILQLEAGGGPNGTLITTEDGPGKGLDSAELERIIDQTILGGHAQQ